ncbi:MAG: DUF4136 domain-containing protein [Bacteroidetes bacterium]|nr:DUF4136 domain-containing protein [Bacteroidota bacterium]
MQNLNPLKFLKRILLVIIMITPVVISSCYYDYGLNTDNYDVVGSFYNPDYNFNNVTKYYFIDSVIHRDGGTVTTQYDNLIKTTTINNLNALGWTRVTDSAGAGVVSVGAVVTTTNYTVSTGSGCWYDYWGYTWCYPYYGNTYEYTTGTIAVVLADLNLRDGNNLPVQWVGVANGLLGQGGNVNQRITNGINKAFEQSPYLR